MALAIFDLDNTLLAGDSDHLWGQFVCREGLVDATDFEERNEQFYRDYQAGKLDIMAYLRFALAPLRGQPSEVLARWHGEFMRKVIRPIILPRGRQLIERHRLQGDELVIITATNEFITRPIADELGIEQLLACEAETVDGRYTGEPRGIPSYKEGKVTRLHAWLEGRDCTLDDAWFYSDSHNDLPLLERVSRPVAVDPDDILRRRAETEGWPIISLRD